MADPTFVDCPLETWQVVATNLTSGKLNIVDTDAKYRWTYRDTTNPAPTDPDEGTPLLGIDYQMSFTSGADVYVYCAEYAGRVRVDR